MRDECNETLSRSSETLLHSRRVARHHDPTVVAFDEHIGVDDLPLLVFALYEGLINLIISGDRSVVIHVMIATTAYQVRE